VSLSFTCVCPQISMMSDMEKTLSQTITKIHEDSMFHISDDDDNDDHGNVSSYPPGATPGPGAGRVAREN
jgi:hypothetical protein